MWRWGKLELSWSFPAVAALALLAGAGEVLPAVLLAAACHEAGHLLALRLAGIGVERVRLTAFGAEILADTRFTPYGREILCALAGPLTNLALALLLGRWGHFYLAAGANVLLACFNLLPVPSLDGGRALYLLASWLAGPFAAETASRRLGLAAAGALTVWAAVMTCRRRAGLFLLLGAAGILVPQLAEAARKNECFT